MNFRIIDLTYQVFFEPVRSFKISVASRASANSAFLQTCFGMEELEIFFPRSISVPRPTSFLALSELQNKILFAQLLLKKHNSHKI